MSDEHVPFTLDAVRAHVLTLREAGGIYPGSPLTTATMLSDLLDRYDELAADHATVALLALGAETPEPAPERTHAPTPSGRVESAILEAWAARRTAAGVPVEAAPRCEICYGRGYVCGVPCAVCGDR